MALPTAGTAAFAYWDFRRYQLARIMVIMAAVAQAVAVAWQVYEITHRAIDLGYTGLVLFLPGLLFLLPAGHVADRYDRRMVVLVCYSLQILCTLTLLIFALRGLHRVEPIFAVLFLIGFGRAFSGPASSALLPHLVPTEHFVNAITWGATVFQIANITGPAVGGLLYTLPLPGRLDGAPLGVSVCPAHRHWLRDVDRFPACTPRTHGASSYFHPCDPGRLSLCLEFQAVAGIDLAGSFCRAFRRCDRAATHLCP